MGVEGVVIGDGERLVDLFAQAIVGEELAGLFEESLADLGRGELLEVVLSPGQAVTLLAPVGELPESDGRAAK